MCVLQPSASVSCSPEPRNEHRSPLLAIPQLPSKLRPRLLAMLPSRPIDRTECDDGFLDTGGDGVTTIGCTAEGAWFKWYQNILQTIRLMAVAGDPQ